MPVAVQNCPRVRRARLRARLLRGLSRAQRLHRMSLPLRWIVLPSK